jgi:hypothetical protein
MIYRSIGGFFGEKYGALSKRDGFVRSDGETTLMQYILLIYQTERWADVPVDEKN